MVKMKVLCILPALGHQHFAKRIAMLQQAGFNVEALAYQRDIFVSGGRVPKCPVKVLGNLAHGRYWSRGTRLLLDIGKVRTAIRRNDLVYAFSPDMALLGLIAGCGLKKYCVLEVLDIRGAQVARGLRGRFVRFIEGLTLRACRLLILTSRGYSAYYREWLRTSTPQLVVENKLDGGFSPRSLSEIRRRPTQEEGRVRIGWFGVLRDEWTLQLLESLLRLEPDRFRVVMAGITHRLAGGDLLERTKRLPSIEYLGEYRSPDDLPDLYGRVDMVMACYPPELPHGWSRSNRYYEACLFQRPLIVREGTMDAYEVHRRDIGLIVEEAEAATAAAGIRGIDRTDLYRWRTNMDALPESVYFGDVDVDRLKTALEGIR